MNRRRLHRWAAWLLPLLIARLFVPVGFMLSMSDAGLKFVLCSGFAGLPAPITAANLQQHHAESDRSAHAMHGESHEQHGKQGSEHQSHEQSICPFAFAGATAGCPVAKAFGEPPSLAAAVPSLRAVPLWNSPAVLIDRIRGPPLV
jgi:hypothetical protein